MPTDLIALRLFCFNIRQYGRQILYFKLGLYVDGHTAACCAPLHYMFLIF